MTIPSDPDTKAPPLRADAARNRRKLLDAARTAFAEQGTEVSVNEIARRAGTAKGTFFRHFATKEDLIAELIAERLVEVTEIVAEVNRTEPPGWRALAMMLERLEAAIGDDRSALHPGQLSPEHRSRALRDMDALHREIGICVVRAQEVGEVRADVTESDIHLLAVGIKIVTAPLKPDHPHIDRRLMRIMLDGLRVTDPSELSGPPVSSAAVGAARMPAAGAHCQHHPTHPHAAP